MKYVNPNFTVNIDWNIQRGASRMREDFRRATLFVFLIGHDNVYPVTYTLEDNVIKAVIEHLQGTGICTCTSVSATPVNWVMDRILGKL